MSLHVEDGELKGTYKDDKGTVTELDLTETKKERPEFIAEEWEIKDFIGERELKGTENAKVEQITAADKAMLDVLRDTDKSDEPKTKAEENIDKVEQILNDYVNEGGVDIYNESEEVEEPEKEEIKVPEVTKPTSNVVNPKTNTMRGSSRNFTVKIPDNGNKPK